MFSRLKGAIDSRIAEEQAKIKAAPASPARSASTAKRTRPKPKVEDDGSRGPDPSTFVIEDESEPPSRIGTPAPTEGGKKETATAESAAPKTMAEGAAERNGDAPSGAVVELPPEVKAKLRKLEKLEFRYQDLLRSYRIAHARAISIEPFEKTLKENTPLTTIKEPEALIEYLNQLNLRGDIIMDELKTVTADRDNYKKKFEQAEAQVQDAKKDSEKAQSANKATSIDEGVKPEAREESRTENGHKSSPSIKSPVSSILGVFSPKHDPQPVAKDNADVSESFFSYDEEVPKLQADLLAKDKQIDTLKGEVQTLQKDLGSVKEENGNLTESLQALEEQLHTKSKELEGLNDQQIDVQEIQSKLDATTRSLDELKTKVVAQEKEADEARAEAASTNTALNESKTRVDELDNKLKLLQTQKETDEGRIKELEAEITKLKEEQVTRLAEQAAQLAVVSSDSNLPKPGSSGSPATFSTTMPATSSSKKKKNKKKKGANAAKETAVTKSDETEGGEEVGVVTPPSQSSLDELHAEISKLRDEVAARDAEIEKLQTKRRTEADLREEIENMQENLLSIGQEHVEAKEQIKELQNEKKGLQDKLDTLAKELSERKEAQEKSAKDEEGYREMMAEFQDLKVKSSSLQSDLGAAQQLATTRYKELTELRGVMEKAQPEMRSLRTEIANLKTVKEELNTRTTELRRLEAREKDLKADLAAFKKQAADRDNEVRSLSEKVTQEANGRLKAEDQARIAGRDLRRVEAEKIELSANGERAARELAKVQEEASRLRNNVKELNSQVAKLTTENQAIIEEVELKTSQYASAQGLVGNMRDQAAEMAMQLKEAKEQSESLEEELVEVQRLLAERTRDGETMRRLLSDVDERADAKVREMRERMETAIEERDRAEEEASTNGRRRAREIDDLKNKIKDAERDLKRALDEKDDLERSQREWKRRGEELEKHSEQATHELNEVNTAMEELRAALDGSERQAREAEKQKSDLRRLLDDANQRYEKLHKSLKSKERRLEELSTGNSSRSSLDLESAASRKINGSANGMAESAYLKTVLLQFLEQKDKRLQAQLVPVLGKLLHFDKKDEQKWIAAITAK